MHSIQSVLSPLMGKIVFSLFQTYGSYFFIQIGDPFLRIREPIEPRHVTSEKAKTMLRRRRVYVIGTWSILVEGCNWILESEQRSACQSDLIAEMEDLFRSVEGQYLVSAQCSHETNSCTLKFDMGASLTLWPRHGGEPDEDQWRLHYNDGSSMGYTNDGSFSFEARKDDS
ncbi:hypothetical protein SBC2_04320 [Caballeronia sp. SBC2]|nr:hypothetical protein SBC2_04320 [Caballeronia sp. SBC2]